MSFIETSLKYRQVTLSVLALLFLAGVWSLLQMPRREDPKISVPQCLVVAYWPGASSNQIEEQVTRHIEECLFKFDEVKKCNTVSSTEDGKVVVTVELMESVKQTDIFWNKLRSEMLLLKQTKLPDGVIGPVVNSEFGDTEALIIGLSGHHLTHTQLKQYAQRLSDHLRTLPSVSKIKRDGEQKEEICVRLDAARMARYRLSLPLIVKTLQSNNKVTPAGDVKGEAASMTLYANGTYLSQDDVANQVVGLSPTGTVVRLKDIAHISRREAEPTSKVRIGADDAVIVSVEMFAGNNIVDFGKDVQQKIDEFMAMVPSDVHLTYISNQPQVVGNNVGHFISEFFIAIAAVIAVILLMLPFRIALVAAMAIPMTVATTLGLMNVFGIELQQVSLAALIVVLGLVVDDAIVVADNYVELLDNGASRWDAAWRSATELVVPILVATLTIIFAFMPMATLTGAVGEFIETLPYTVSIALASSFLVAMFFTPILCITFVKKGLHNGKEKTGRRSLVDRMQAAYNKALDWCVAHQRLTIAAGCVPLLLALLIYKYGIRQQFFPSAERNQFVVELWMPSGTSLATTEEAIGRIAKLLDGDDRVTASATFIGTSAPRFYYNFAPEFPTANYAQIVVNTTSNETTLALADELLRKVDEAVPEGRPKVRLMQQGKPLKSPVEVRITGEDIPQLQRIGAKVDSILRHANGTSHIESNWREDYAATDVRVKPVAGQMGYTTELIGMNLYMYSKGLPVTELREGDDIVPVVLKADADNLQDLYIQSLTGMSALPLHQIADIAPVWKTGRVMHRNGLRTLTIGAEADGDVLPSEILADIRPQIAALQLPEGYSIAYGGEYENQQTTMPEMVQALLIGLVLIFFIILIQFRTVKETLLILFTIPLSTFGALLGLLLTGNNFGFTAFVGIICLSGIVVRNAIILIDHIHELHTKHAMPLREAAIESGKRRLRPIFLTATAAAIGVIPMIVSGSSMWSPLASVIAFGVVWSMVVALLMVPVMYTRWIACLLLLTVFSFDIKAEGTATVTVSDVVNTALAKNNLLNISEKKAQEEQLKVEQAKIKYFPQAQVATSYMHRFSTSSLDIGSQVSSMLTPVLAASLSPAVAAQIAPLTTMSYEIGRKNSFVAGAMLYQPLLQLPLIATGVQVAETERRIATLQHTKAVSRLTNAVETMCYGLLAVRRNRLADQKQLELAERQLADARAALEAGKTTMTSITALETAVADKRRALSATENKEDDIVEELRKQCGMDLHGVEITVDDAVERQYTAADIAQNTDTQLAHEQATMAQQGVKAAKLAFLPDVGVTAGYAYQTSLDILPRHNPFAGVTLKWDLQGLVSNARTLRQRRLQQEEATENEQYAQKTLAADITKARHRLAEAEQTAQVASQMAATRRSELTTEYDRRDAGMTTPTKVLEKEAALAKAEADYFAARQAVLTAEAELRILAR